MINDLYSAEDKNQRMRIIIITVVAAVVILGVSAWAIIAIIAGGEPKSNIEETIAAETDKPITEVIEVPSTPSDGVVVAETPVEPTSTEATPDVPVVSTVPQTGPLDAIPIALIVGSLIAYLGSRELVERNRNR